ncbi:MAG: NHL repeat-containing protein [Thermomicrobiales bacterium]
MDHEKFDEASKALSTGTSRRRGLAAAAGVLLGAGLTAAAAKGDDSSGSKNTKKRIRKQRPAHRPTGKKSSVQGPCGDGSGPANRCKGDDDCCTNRCSGGRCRSARRGEECINDQACCSWASGLTCQQGICVKGIACSAATCKNGCCRNGECLAGTDDNACGTGGQTCASCGSKRCAANTCTAREWVAKTTLGTAGSSDNQFDSLRDIALSTDGLEMYVVDKNNNRVTVWTRASLSANWAAQAQMTNGAGSANDQVSNPYGIAMAPNSLELYITDPGNYRVAVWTRVTTSGSWYAQNPIGNGYGSNNDQFNAPRGVAISPDGLELYVADKSSDRVSVWTRTTIGGTWTAQTPLGNGNGSNNNQFASPRGVAISPNGLELYIADINNHRIAVWTRATTAGAWAAQAALGSGPGTAKNQFSSPRGVAISPDGLNLFIGDTNSSRIAVWTRASTNAAWTAQHPLGSGYGTDTDEFNAPRGLVFSPNGQEFFVADTNNNRDAVWAYL